MPHSKIPEFDRQLVGQEKGLNALTVQEYVTGRAAFAAGQTKRDSQIARDARSKFEERLNIEYSKNFSRLGHSPQLAKTLAVSEAKAKMRTLAALHNPDLISGGADVIDDFGDRWVNSSIGPQWRSRVKHLDDAVERYLKASSREPGFDPKLETMNASLERCK
jgi:hypothetical protein